MVLERFPQFQPVVIPHLAAISRIWLLFLVISLASERLVLGLFCLKNTGGTGKSDRHRCVSGQGFSHFIDKLNPGGAEV